MTTKITEKNISNLANIGVQWQSVFTGDGSTGLTTVAGRGYFIDTTSGTVTVTLPASPSAGDVVVLKDYARTWGTNAVSLASTTFDGASNTPSFSTNGQIVTLVYMDGTKGWSLINEDTTTGLGAEFIAATGGTIATSGDIKIHSFTGDGCFVVSNVGNAAGSNTIQLLAVAGGGGGGGDRGSGGGGGGMILTPSCGIPVSATTYPISVGGGGSGGPGPGPGPARHGTSGTDTTAFSLTAVGGGEGKGGGGGVTDPTGGTGGSGGGGSDGCNASPRSGGPGPGTQPSRPGNSGAYGFGNPGGAGGPYPSQGTGGGGGASCGGVNSSPSASGAGGAGKSATPIFGAAPQPFYSPSNGVYAGGGGGGAASGTGPGGNRGDITAGNGGCSPLRPGNSPGDNAAANTGGGGGGGSNVGSQGAGGSGGKGIVLIRYKFQ